MRQLSFWMLYAENGNAPTFKHPTYESALIEARRLSEKLSVPVYVLHARQKVEKVAFLTTTLINNDELPF